MSGTMRSAVESWATKLWAGEGILVVLFFNCITKNVLKILYVSCSNLSCLSSFWSLCFIGMTSKDASLRESSYVLTFSIQFTHSKLHSGVFTGYLGSCAANGNEMPKTRWWEHFPMCLLLTRIIRETWEQPWSAARPEEKGKWSFRPIADQAPLFYTSGACFENIKPFNI